MHRLLITLIGTLLLSACAASPSYTGTYVAGDDTELVHLNMVETSNNQINATLTVTALDYGAGELKTQIVGFSGISDDEAISLIGTSGKGGSMSFAKDGAKLIWQHPATGQSYEFVKTDRAAYQNRLVELSDQVNAID
jgi:hypothetical protein